MLDDDSNLKIDEALEHSLWARNMEIGRHGMSPYQVVYGKSPFLPGITEGTPMSDSLITRADAVRLHFQRQESARTELRKYDSNRRLKDALKSRLQPYQDARYEEGDLIIFQDSNDRWTGPAEVKITDSKTLFVIHNGQMKKVATCRARPWVADTDNEGTDSYSDCESSENETAENSEEKRGNNSKRMERQESQDLEILETEPLESAHPVREEECSERMENKKKAERNKTQLSYNRMENTETVAEERN